MSGETIAHRCLVGLVKHVLSHQGQTLTGINYQDLASNIGLFNKHDEPHCRLGKSLGIMGHMIAAVDVGWGEKPPILQSLVVSKHNGLPSNGMNEFWPGYEKLSDIEKRSKSLAEWQVIADFGSRWNTVLRALGLKEVEKGVPPLAQSSQSRVRAQKAASTPRRGHGESPAHAALKEYVKRNPLIVGADKAATAFTEYALPSLDTLDVLFKMPDRWVGVEVKSSVSDQVPGDYERGVYQAVKYRALLEAMRKDARHAVPDSVEVVLVLEGRLPATLKALVKVLSVGLAENIKAKSAS